MDTHDGLDKAVYLGGLSGRDGNKQVQDCMLDGQRVLDPKVFCCECRRTRNSFHTTSRFALPLSSPDIYH